MAASLASNSDWQRRSWAAAAIPSVSRAVSGLRERRPRDVQLFDERVARPRGVGEAGRELRMTPGETFDGGVGLRCTLLLDLAQCRFELQQPFLQDRADFRGSCR